MTREELEESIAELRSCPLLLVCQDPKGRDHESCMLPKTPQLGGIGISGAGCGQRALLDQV